MRFWLPALILALLSTAAAADDACPPGNLLAGRAPINAEQVSHTVRLTDGIAPEEGDGWNTHLTATFGGPKAHVTWDLGRPIKVNSILVQGDNNDTYQVEGCVDLQTCHPLWTVPIHPNPGMRVRLQQGLNAEIRYLRVGGPKGDDAYSLGEVQAFCQHPATWPPPLTRKTGKAAQTTDARKMRMSQGKIMLGILGGLVFLGLFLARKGDDLMLDLIAPAGGSAALLYAGWMTVQEAKRRSAAADAFVWEKRGLILAALGVAALAFLLARRHLRGRPIARLAERGALAMLLVSSAVTWVNFGTFHGSRVIHYWDSFHYFMGSKYFKETRYTLLYHCSGVGEIDDGLKDEFKTRQLRDLKDNRLGPALPLLEQDAECRAAFTPERWAAFREDLRLFRHHMGKSWWAKMFMDHGYNATPVWNLVGHALTNQGWRTKIPPEGHSTAAAELARMSPMERIAARKAFTTQRLPAFERQMYRLVAIDFLLYLGIFAFIGWAFGLRAAALAMVIWGTGYPWAYFWTGGGFGRVPWLFTAVAGFAFLKKGYPLLGGFGLTWSALLRVFPGGLVIGVAAKIAWEVLRGRTPKQQAEEPAPEGAPSWLARLYHRIGRGHVRFILGCTLAVGVLVPASLPSADGWRAWPEFLENSLKHKDTPLTNHMGLPTLLSYHPARIARQTKDSKLSDPFAVWKQERKRTLKERRLIHAGLLLLFLGLIAYVGRRLKDWEVTALSVVFLIGIFELTCYYYSFVVLLAPFALRRWRYVAVLIGMAITTQWFQHVWTWYDEQYTWETAAVLAPVLYLLGHTAWEQWRGIERAPEAERPLPEAPPPAAATPVA